MNRNTIIWTVILLLAVAYLLGRTTLTEHGMGKAYVRAVEVNSTDPDPSHRWTIPENATPAQYRQAMAEDPNQTEYKFSLSRTIEIWLAAFFTLCILSFLYGDNPFFKLAESVIIGVSAAYGMIVMFWTTIIPNLFGKLFPGWIQSWAMPGIEAESDYSYTIPLILGIMLLWKLAPKGKWISRWPLAFIIGTTAGMRLVGFLHANFLAQINSTILPLWAVSSADSFDFWAMVRAMILVVGVLCGIVYFLFSFEHKGIVGKTAKMGIWVLMITFGASFAYTVMGRIALIAMRIEFLLDDWLWLIDPAMKRAGL
ncbi:MAG: hypothetical protein JRH15_11735 [Deltaproteobacteria bacterium]|nr:hypothetical protein [Deltaproteobacteria bacterium]